MARVLSNLQWNHIAGQYSPLNAALIDQQQGAVAIDAMGGADGDLVEQLDPHAPPTPREITLPTRRQSSETAVFKLSITPLDTLKQSS
jgi:hypothetical protein